MADLILGKLRLGPLAVAALSAVPTADRPMLVVGRDSQEGKYGSTAMDLYELADSAAAKLDVHLRDALPSTEQIIYDLRNAPPAERVTSSDGNGNFKNRFVVYDLRPQGTPLIILASNGSGSRIDQRGFKQPAIERIAQLLVDEDPSSIIVKRWDRSGRGSWALAPLMMPITTRRDAGMPISLGDTVDGFVAENFVGDFQIFTRGEHARQEALQIRLKTSTKPFELTDDAFVDGRLNVHLPSMPPPGVGRAVLLRYDAVRDARRIVWYLDQPGAIPTDAAYGVSEVCDEEGRPIYQVDVVRWFLEYAYTKEFPTGAAIGEELVRRGYSTAMMRAMGGPTARLTHTTTVGRSRENADWSSVLGALLRNLDAYRTGILIRETKAAEGQVLRKEISNFIPLDGPWGQPEWFDRIEAAQKAGYRWKHAGRTPTFSGLPVTLNGTPAKLFAQPSANITTASSAQSLEPVRYGFRPAEGGSKKLLDSYKRFLSLPHSALAELVIGACTDAAEFPRPQYEVIEDSEVIHLERERDRLERELGSLTERNKALLAQLSETDEGGQRILRGAMLEDAQKKYNARSAEVDNASRRVNQATSRLAQEQQRLDRLRRGLETEAMIDAVASLLDPMDNHYSQMWLQAIKNLEVNTTEISRGKTLRYTEIALAADLHISHGTRHILTHTTITIENGHAITNSRERAAQLLDQLRRGIPAPVENWDSRRLRSLIVEAAGLTKKQMAITGCDDPDLLRLIFGYVWPRKPNETKADLLTRLRQASTDSHLSSVFGNVIELGERIHQLWICDSSPGTSWLRQPGGNIVELCLAACRGREFRRENTTTPENWGQTRFGLKRRFPNDLDFSDPKQVSLLPCHFCGSTRRAPMMIAEVTGLVCLDCRADSAGVTWPAQPYNRFLPQPRRWSSIPGGRQPTGKRMTATLPTNNLSDGHPSGRTLSELAATERATILDKYASGRLLTEILNEHSLRLRTFAALRAAEGVPPRKRKPRQAPGE